MAKTLLPIVFLVLVNCSAVPQKDLRTIAQEKNQSNSNELPEESNEELRPLKVEFANKSVLTNGYAGVIKLTFAQNVEINANDLKGEVSFKLIDGGSKTLNFPFYGTGTGEFATILGIPYKTLPGQYELKILIKSKLDTEEVIHPFEVFKGSYGKDSPIKVEPNTVEPDEKTQKIVEAQQKVLNEIYSSPYDQKLWTPPFKVPVSNPVITSNYGNARTYNGTLASYHSGMDYRGNEKTPLNATNDGIIRLRQSLHFTGNTVIIDHGKGLFTLYAHMSKFSKLIKPGKFVKKGQYLGQAGSTGRVTGPHLHFGFKIHGELVNPTFLYTLE
ncbi:MAG: M23 family metallopeptidase [Bacteriovoracaceae bacterium]